jgi:Thioredoxin
VSRARHARRKDRQKERELTEKVVERARTSRRKFVIRTGGVALAALAVAVAGVLFSIGVSDVAGSSAQPSSVRVEKEVTALVSDIPQRGDTLGQPSAPITLQVFGDLESADVRTFVLWLLPDIIREWIRTNIVKIQYRSFMSASAPYPNVFVSQQAAALAAGVQNRLWNFIETFYHEQGQEHTRYVTEAYLEGIARQVSGLNISEWESAREHSQLAKQVIMDDRVAREIRFPDDPVFLIGRTGGRLVPWPGYRLYEEPGLKPGLIRRPVHPLSFITSKKLRTVIEHLP